MELERIEKLQAWDELCDPHSPVRVLPEQTPHGPQLKTITI